MSIRIGIDPGTKKNGVAVMLNGRYYALYNMDYFELCEYCDHLPADVMFYVEDPEAMNFVYSGKQNDDAGAAYGQRIARNVGNVQHAGRMIILMLKNKGFFVRPIKPQRGLTKKTKNNTRLFNRLTKWKGKSNEHKRDAAMLIYSFFEE